MYGERGKYLLVAGTMTVDTGTTGVLDAVSDRAVVTCEDLANIVLIGNAIVKSTTVTLVFEISYDGVNWLSAGADATIASFSANNTAYALAQSDAHGMSLPIKMARMTSTVFTGAGSYTFAVAGWQRPGYA